MPNTDDMRYVRTEQAIRSAFMELVAKQPAASLTVTSLCRRAGISRNAFYLHYPSVSGLYGTLVGELVDDIRTESIASAERSAEHGSDGLLAEAIVEALSRHEDVLRALLPSDEGPLAKCLAEGIEGAFVEAALRFGEHGDSLEHRIRCAYTAGALMGMVSRWIAGTDLPLTGLLPHFKQLSAATIEASTAFLLG